MTVFARLLARPALLLWSLVLCTLCCLPVLSKLSLEGDVVDLLPRSSQAAQTFARFTRGLGTGQELIVLISGSDRQRLTQFADTYAEAIARHPEVLQVTHRIGGQSLSYLRDHLLLLLSDEDLDELARRITKSAMTQRVADLRALLSAPGGSSLAPLLVADPLDLVPLITRHLQSGSGLPVDTQSGYLRTADGTALLIKVRPRFDPLLWQRSERLIGDLTQLAQRLGATPATTPDTSVLARTLRGLGPLGSDLQVTSFADKPTPTVGFSGSYAFPPYYRRWIEQDMTRSTVLSVTAVLLLFGLFFRSLRILPWVLIPLLFAGLWTAVLATLCFGRLSGVSMAFSSILVAIGIDIPIQLYSRLREALTSAPDLTTWRDTVRRTLAELAAPAWVATMGPAIVFFACGLSDYKGLNQLGLLAGLGLLLNCLAMLTIFPSLLLMLPLSFWYRPVPSIPTDRGLLPALARHIQAKPRRILFVAVVLLVGALPFLSHVRFADRLFAVEPGDMPPALTQAEISRRFGEQQRFFVILLEDSDGEVALQKSDRWLIALEAMRRKGQLRGYESVSPLSPSQKTQHARRDRLAALDLPAAASQLAQALVDAGFSPEPFAPALALLRSAPTALTPLTLDGLAQTELGFLVRTHVAETPARPGVPPARMIALYLFAPIDDRLPATVAELQALTRTLGGAITGMPLLEQELRALLGQDLLRITLFAALGVVLLLALYYRRPRPMVAVLLPLVVAWALFGASLTIFSLPLNLYNLIAVPLCIGYGIDDHIFMVHRHVTAPPGERDLARLLVTTGRAIILTTLATVAGFAGLIPAHFVGLRYLGLGGALAVLLCLAAALLALPALLVLLFPRTHRSPLAP